MRVLRFKECLMLFGTIELVRYNAVVAAQAQSQPPQPPPLPSHVNDVCTYSWPIVIANDSTNSSNSSAVVDVKGDLAQARLSFAEFPPQCDSPRALFFLRVPNLWYTLTVPKNMRVQLQRVTTPKSLVVQLLVLRGTACGQWELKCVKNVVWKGNNDTNATSSLSFAAWANSTYQIVVRGSGDSDSIGITNQTNATFHFTLRPLPNDTSTDAPTVAPKPEIIVCCTTLLCRLRGRFRTFWSSLFFQTLDMHW